MYLTCDSLSTNEHYFLTLLSIAGTADGYIEDVKCWAEEKSKTLDERCSRDSLALWAIINDLDFPTKKSKNPASYFFKIPVQFFADGSSYIFADGSSYNLGDENPDCLVIKDFQLVKNPQPEHIASSANGVLGTFADDALTGAPKFSDYAQQKSFHDVYEPMLSAVSADVIAERMQILRDHITFQEGEELSSNALVRDINTLENQHLVESLYDKLGKGISLSQKDEEQLNELANEFLISTLSDNSLSQCSEFAYIPNCIDLASKVNNARLEIKRSFNDIRFSLSTYFNDGNSSFSPYFEREQLSVRPAPFDSPVKLELDRINNVNNKVTDEQGNCLKKCLTVSSNTFASLMVHSEIPVRSALLIFKHNVEFPHVWNEEILSQDILKTSCNDADIVGFLAKGVYASTSEMNLVHRGLSHYLSYHSATEEVIQDLVEKLLSHTDTSDEALAILDSLVETAETVAEYEIDDLDDKKRLRKSIDKINTIRSKFMTAKLSASLSELLDIDIVEDNELDHEPTHAPTLSL